MVVSVVPGGAQAGVYVFAHEIGHNLGLDHDPEHATSYYAEYPNDHAFRMPGYRDVMAYSNGCVEAFGQDCPVFAGFSDPERTRSDRKLGVRGVSEAVAVLKEFLPYIAGDTKCMTSATKLCLNNHRFQVETLWVTGTQAGRGQAIPRTGDSGEFWFFAPTNIEAIVKVLDGCGLGGHYWVFSGGLTNVLVDLLVTDTVTGELRSYRNPEGRAFQPVQDTSAFLCR